jgi:multicomponent Na+:H+ antiporter subunit D
MIADISPGLILIVGALLVLLLRGHLRSVWIVALPLLALLHLASLPSSEAGQIELMGLTLTSLRVDGLSRVFGFAFLVATFIGMVYALHLRDAVQHVAGLLYAGSAVGAVFAGDLVVLFFFWVGAAVASVFLVWAARTEAAYGAGMRYIFILVLSGLLLFEGLLHFHHDYGTIAFEALGLQSIAGWMILLGFGIACAFPLLHMWLPDAYAKASPAGSVILQSFTTVLGIYALARAFPGVDLLVPVGIVMVLFALVFAAAADDLRRVMSYVLISQAGVMVIGVGIGSEAALAGVAINAFAHVLYMSLLFMVVGAVSEQTGTALISRLGGLDRTMPWTAAFAAIGALSISAPLLGGFAGKVLIVSAAAEGGHGWAWSAIVAGIAGAFLLAGPRLLWLVFFAGSSAKPQGEAPANMRTAMGLAAVLSLALGLLPGTVLALLPDAAGLEVYTRSNVVAQLQILAFAGLAFALLASYGMFGRPAPGTLLDADWVYRRPGRAAAVAALGWGRRTRSAALGFGVQGLSDFANRIYRYFGPRSIIARNWTTGAMAFWTTVLLAVWLLAYFV